LYYRRKPLSRKRQQAESAALDRFATRRHLPQTRRVPQLLPVIQRHSYAEAAGRAAPPANALSTAAVQLIRLASRSGYPRRCTGPSLSWFGASTSTSIG